MKIVAGNTEVVVKGIYGSPTYHNGAVVDSLRISLPGDITQDEISALCEHSWEIYSDDNVLQSVHSGCNYVEEYSLTFLKLTEKSELQARLDNTQEQTTLYRDALIQAGIDPLTVLTNSKGALND